MCLTYVRTCIQPHTYIQHLTHVHTHRQQSPRRSLEDATPPPAAKLPRIDAPLVSPPRLCAAVWSCACGAKNCSRDDCAACGWLELPRHPGPAIAVPPAEAAEAERFRRALYATLYATHGAQSCMTLRFLQSQLVHQRGARAPPSLARRFGTLLAYVSARPHELRVEEAPLPPALGYARYVVSFAAAAPPAVQRNQRSPWSEHCDR